LFVGAATFVHSLCSAMTETADPGYKYEKSSKNNKLS